MYHHLKSDLKLNKAEHRGSYFKIINHQYPDNFVRKYIIQSLENKQIKNVFIHEIFPCPELESRPRPATSTTSIMQDMQSTDFTDSQSELFDMPLDMNQPDPTYVQPFQTSIYEPDQPPVQPVQPGTCNRFKLTPTNEELDKIAQARTERRTDKQTAWSVKLLRCVFKRDKQ
jgi:hypothetical protein